jgi:hypothetical protein
LLLNGLNEEEYPGIFEIDYVKTPGLLRGHFSQS